MKFLSAVIFAMIAASGFAQNAGNETIAAGRDKPCNSFNNDCQSCIQYSNTGGDNAFILVIACSFYAL